jgi:hypothetical protein
MVGRPALSKGFSAASPCLGTRRRCAADIWRGRRHIGDFSGWKDHDVYQTAFHRLLRDLRPRRRLCEANSGARSTADPGGGLARSQRMSRRWRSRPSA